MTLVLGLYQYKTKQSMYRHEGRDTYSEILSLGVLPVMSFSHASAHS